MELKIEYVDINSIKPYKNNAKLHPQEQIEQIKKSIEQFGMDDPIGIWKDEIVEGHGRLIACQELGMTEVPIIRLDHLTDEERKAYTLAHNKLTMNSDFDIDILNEELQNFDTIDMSDFGFDLEFDTGEEQEIIEDEVPDVPDEPKAKLGDIYQLGNHRLMCGDSTSEDDVRILMNDKNADLLFTDPPYNVNISNSDGLQIKNDNMDNESFRNFLHSAFKCANQSLKPGGGLHGKDLSKADVSVNIYAFLKAQETGKVVELCCAIGDDTIDGKPYSEIVEIAREYIKSVGGFEKFAEWGLF